MRRKSGRLPEAHFLVCGTVDGWYVCSCGCGYVAVCFHCVPGASQQVPTCLCDREHRRLKVGAYAETDESTHYGVLGG